MKTSKSSNWKVTICSNVSLVWVQTNQSCKYPIYPDITMTNQISYVYRLFKHSPICARRLWKSNPKLFESSQDRLRWRWPLSSSIQHQSSCSQWKLSLIVSSDWSSVNGNKRPDSSVSGFVLRRIRVVLPNRLFKREADKRLIELKNTWLLQRDRYLLSWWNIGA